ncbi:MAG: ribonuclease, partial [Actinomycetota bacterium]|nr:ribonuclease [Actinomycetota bacterium]
RFAGTRALAALSVTPDLIILDGNYDWLTDPARVGLLGFLKEGFGLDSVPAADVDSVPVPGFTVSGMSVRPVPAGLVPVTPCVPVRTLIKADMSCSSVAAASVLAKVERDAMMVALSSEVPGYAWELNKGYSAPEHFLALQSHGATVHHRRSWRLPGLGGWPETGPCEVAVMGAPRESSDA